MSAAATLIWLLAHNISLDLVDPWSGEMVSLTPPTVMVLDRDDPWSGKKTTSQSSQHRLVLDVTDPWQR